MVLISHKYKFILVHIPKTGGTSVIQALLQTLGNDVHYYPEIDHMSQQEIISHFQNDFEDYIFLAIVRNPMDLLYSYYCYKRGNTQYLSDVCDLLDFESFVTFWYNHGTFGERILDEGQHAFVKDDTRIFYLEDINHTLPLFFKECFNFHLEIPHLNKSQKEQLEFSSETKKKIYKKYHKDFEVFHF